MTDNYISARGRDLRIDVLRGYFVFAMVVDHIGAYSPVQLLTGGNRFFTSAAEGFILTAGLMAGLVYGRVFTRDGVAAGVRKVLGKAWPLYLLTAGMTLLLAPISEAFHLPWAQGVDLSNSLSFVVSVLTLHQTYYLADVLLLYTLLFALAPLALILVQRGYARWLLAGSWLLWWLYQLVPAAATVTWPIAGNNLFEFSAWQALFVSGLVLGCERHRLSSLTAAGQRRLHLATGLGTAALIGLYVLVNLPAASLPLPAWLNGFESWQAWVQLKLFAKVAVAPGRILASAVVFTFLFLSLTRWWGSLGRLLQPIFAPLGQHSLYAFTAHVALVTVVALVLKPFGLAGVAALSTAGSVALGVAAEAPRWLNALLQLGSAALIWLLARRQLFSRSARTRLIWRASPAILALLAAFLLPLLPGAAISAQSTASALSQGSSEGASAPAAGSVSAAVLARARAYGTPITSLVTPVAAAATPAAGPKATATPAPSW